MERARRDRLTLVTWVRSERLDLSLLGKSIAFSWQLSWSRGSDGRVGGMDASRRRSSSTLDHDEACTVAAAAVTQHDAGTNTSSTGRLRLNHAL